jgi:hypothetical protein
MKKLLFTAALLVPGPAYGQNRSADLSVQVVPGSGPPNGIACAIGPNYAGSIPADVQTAGFTTCALNSDFSTPFFTNLSNWLGGPNCTGGAGSIWFNSDNGGGTGGAPPCSDYSIITDGSNGQVLDQQFNNADYSAGRRATQLLSVDPSNCCGHLYPTGEYVEWRGRVTTQTTKSYNNSGGQFLAWGAFRYAPSSKSGTAPFIEWDWSEFYFNPIGIAAGSPPGSNMSGVSSPVPTSMQQCPTNCTTFDPTVMHTYGFLVTTDGNQAMSQCTYIDGTKLGCQNFISVSPARTTFQMLEQLILELGPEHGTVPNFSGPQDVLIEYVRVFTCSTWNSSGSPSSPAPGPTCAGPLVTH